MFHGSMVALVTPFNEQGQLCVKTLESLIEFHIEQGTTAIVAAGTTGEAATLSIEEKLRVIEYTVKVASNRIAVIAGTALAATSHTIDLTQKAMDLGADAALIMTPAYIKPTQAGLVEHFSAIAKAAHLPIILYNVPGRTACDLLPETIETLSRISNIIGAKEASGSIERTQEIVQRCGSSLDVYSGEDALTFALMKEGAKGVISVATNVAPKQMQAMCKAALAGDWQQAKQYHQALLPLFDALFWQSNPIPVKWALAHMNLVDTGVLRLPLTSLSPEYHSKLAEIINNL